MSSKKKKDSIGGAFEKLGALREELKRREAANEKKAPPAAPTPVVRAEKNADEEANLLRRAYAGVQPIDRTRGSRPQSPLGPLPGERPAVRESAPDQGGREAVHERLRALTLGAARFEVTDPGDHAEGRRIDVPLEQLRRLRRGNNPIDARLDLHGMGAQQARSRLDGFLRAARAGGERCVLVIHGKGEHSPMGIGVLRGEISAWLSQGASSEHVAAFATAREADGGQGAVYVLLRR